MNKRKFGPWWLLLFFWAELCFMELVVHAATAPQFWQPELVLLMLYPLVPAVLLFALCRLFPPRANRVLGPVCSGLCYIFFASQLVYYSIFHCFYSAYSMGNGGQVMQFWKVTLHAIRKNWLPLSLMLLPPAGPRRARKALFGGAAAPSVSPGVCGAGRRRAFRPDGPAAGLRHAAAFGL